MRTVASCRQTCSCSSSHAHGLRAAHRATWPRRNAVSLLALLPALLMASCGETQLPPTRVTLPLGGGASAAPLVLGGADMGILRDQTAYQPAAGGPAGGGASGTAAGGGAASGDAAAQVAQTVRDFVNVLKDREMEVVWRFFDAAHIAALSEDDRNVVAETMVDKLDFLRRSVESKLDTASAAQALGALTAAAAPTINVIDADHATATPNLCLALFGPVKATPSMSLARVNNEWKIQFDAPLTADEAKQIVEFHKNFQAGIDKVIEAIEQSDTLDVAKLAEALGKALAGQPIDMAPSGGGEKPAGAEEKKEGEGEKKEGEKKEGEDGAPSANP